MCRFTRKIALVVFVATFLILSAVADTGTPFLVGSTVEVTTPGGTVAGVLQKSTTPGWILILEPSLKAPTAVPDKAVSFIRVKASGPLAIPAPGPTRVTAAPAQHFIHGQPRVTNTSRFELRPKASGPLVPGVTVLTRFAYTVGHYDRFKTPAWVAMRWDKHHYDISEAEPKHKRPFEADLDLPAYARAEENYQHSIFHYERGHMARHEDLSGFPDGSDKRRGSREGCLMSNIVPQKQRGHRVWGVLENEHRDIVTDSSAGIKQIWIICGPVFRGGNAVQLIGTSRVGAPHAVYKIIAWQGANGKLHARGYIIGQEDRSLDLRTYLKTIDEIEAETGLDFFPDLPNPEQSTLEATRFTTLWGPN